MTFPTFVVLEPTTARPPALGTRRATVPHGSTYGIEIPADVESPTADQSAGNPRPVTRAALRTRVSVVATDRISADWASAWLRAQPEITLLPSERAREAGVLLYLTARAETQPMGLLRRYSGDSAICDIPKVLVSPCISGDALLEAVGHGVVSYLEYTSTSLSEVTEALIEADRGGSRLPGSLTRVLTDEVREQRRDSSAIARKSGLEPREIDVLRMLAEGDDVREIAARLRYSESTVKGIIYDVVKRLGLRNRVEAVAYGARIGAY
ncbi:MAG TPA: LuxR C-terminal-related transcriptional regulator [Ornithinicoccus sp.]|nr:LuxR C-terminal-related transcriptional regulator [Ornithinicoccus sp.]